MNSDHFDIVIVGGGPAGSACATLLARGGRRVAVLDKARFPREKICGDCVNPGVWNFLELLGVADTLRSLKLSTIDSFSVANSNGRSICARIPSDHSRPFFAIKRSLFDGILLGNASQAGATVFDEAQVTGIKRRGRWEVSLLIKNREHSRLTCNILVGADGRNSFVAQKLAELGFGNAGTLTRRKEDRVGIQWNTRFQPSMKSSVGMFLYSSGYGGIVNVDEERANVAMVAEARLASLATTDFPEFIERTMLANPRAQELFSDLTPSNNVATAFPITPILRHSNHPSAFLIGDARRTVEPFTGEGILFALQDGGHIARRILTGRESRRGRAFSKLQSTFWVNRVYSPALKNGWPAEYLVRLGATIPSLVPLAVKSVIHSRI